MRRPLALFLLALLFLAVGLVAGRLREPQALDPLVDEVPVGPAVAVIAALPSNDEVLGDMVSELLRELAGGDTPLLDRPPSYDAVDSWRMAPLRAADLGGIERLDARFAVEKVLGVRGDEGQDALLARAPGVMSAVTVGCAFPTLVAELAAEDGAQSELIEYAEVPLERQVVRWSRELQVDGRTALARWTVQTEPAGDALLMLYQAWELDLLVETGAHDTVRLRLSWVEAESEEFPAESRLWAGWTLYGAWEEARRWTQACASGRGAERGGEVERTRAVTSGGSDPSSVADGGEDHAAVGRLRGGTPGGDGASREDQAGRALRDSVPLAPLCGGAKLVEVAPHAKKAHETILELKALDAEIDSISADLPDGDPLPPVETANSRRIRRDRVDVPLAAWQLEGIDNWMQTLGLKTVTDEERTMLRRLVDRFGGNPTEYEVALQHRLRQRWASGALREFLRTDDVRVPVCPADLEYATEQMQWTAPYQRTRYARDVEFIVGAILLESGSVRAASEAQWAALRQIYSLSSQIKRIFESPSIPVDEVDL